MNMIKFIVLVFYHYLYQIIYNQSENAGKVCFAGGDFIARVGHVGG
jgi:hypothetical protein